MTYTIRYEEINLGGEVSSHHLTVKAGETFLLNEEKVSFSNKEELYELFNQPHLQIVSVERKGF